MALIASGVCIAAKIRIRPPQRTIPSRLLTARTMEGYLFQLLEHALISLRAHLGETLLVVGRKP